MEELVLKVGEQRTCFLRPDGRALNTLETRDVFKKEENFGEGAIVRTFFGRSNRVVKRFGAQVHLPSVENVVSNVLGSSCVCAVNTGGRLLCVIVCDEKASLEANREDVRREIRRLCGDAAVPDDFHAVASSRIPVNENGKIDVENLLLLFEEDHLNGSSNGAKLEDEITRILTSTLNLNSGPKRLTDGELWDRTFDELGGTSFAAIEVINRLERVFQITLTDGFDVLMKKNSLANFFNHVVHRKENQTQSSLQQTSKVTSFTLKSCDIPQRFGEKDEDGLGVFYSRRGRTNFPEQQSIGKYVSCSSKLKMEVVWEIPMKKCVDASPLILRRRSSEDPPVVLVGSHSGDFVCVSLHSGREIWRVTLPDRVESSGNYIDVRRDFIKWAIEPTRQANK